MQMAAAGGAQVGQEELKSKGERAFARWVSQANEFLSAEKLTVRAFFKKFDRDGDGFVSTREVRVALKELVKIRMTFDEIDALVDYWDRDRSGTVDYGEFTRGLKYSFSPLKEQDLADRNKVSVFHESRRPWDRKAKINPYR